MLLSPLLFSDEFLLVLDSELRIVEASSYAPQFAEKEFLGQNLLDIVEPARRNDFESSLRGPEQHSEEFEAELKLPSRTAICCWKISKTDKVRVMARDLTKDIQKKQQLQSTLDRLNLALSTMEMGIWELNDVQKDLIWDDRMYTLYGLKREDFPDSKKLYEAAYASIDTENMDLNVEDLEQAKRNGMEIHARYRVNSKNGPGRYLRVFGRPLQNKTERTYFGVVWDETETMRRELLQKQTEAKMMASAKMFALGEMSGGVAHEINNPLTVIQARAFQLQQMAENTPIDPAKVIVAAESISKTADKIARIVRSLRSFAREGDSDVFEIVSTQNMIEELIEFTQSRSANAGIAVKMKPAAAPLEFEGRRMQIGQALLSLLNNSLEAVKDLPQKWIEFEVVDKGDQFEITVTDSGTGIPAEVAEKMFQPFFTTREVGHGMGLGLSTAMGAVKAHNGEILYDAQSPNTRFVIRLPKFQ